MWCLSFIFGVKPLKIVLSLLVSMTYEKIALQKCDLENIVFLEKREKDDYSELIKAWSFDRQVLQWKWTNFIIMSKTICMVCCQIPPSVTLLRTIKLAYQFSIKNAWDVKTRIAPHLIDCVLIFRFDEIWMNMNATLLFGFSVFEFPRRWSFRLHKCVDVICRFVSSTRSSC